MANLKVAFVREHKFQFGYGWKFDEKDQKKVEDRTIQVGSGANGATIQIKGHTNRPEHATAILPISRPEVNTQTIAYLETFLAALLKKPKEVEDWVAENARKVSVSNTPVEMNHDGKVVKLAGKLAADGAVLFVTVSES